MYGRVFFPFVTMKVCFMGAWTKAWGRRTLFSDPISLSSG